MEIREKNVKSQRKWINHKCRDINLYHRRTEQTKNCKLEKKSLERNLLIQGMPKELSYNTITEKKIPGRW